jgi:hypothetical protein
VLGDRGPGGRRPRRHRAPAGQLVVAVGRAIRDAGIKGRSWPDSDESARAAVGVVLAARADPSGSAAAPQVRTSW